MYGTQRVLVEESYCIYIMECKNRVPFIMMLQLPLVLYRSVCLSVCLVIKSSCPTNPPTMAMLLARTAMRRVPSKTVGVQRRFLNNGKRAPRLHRLGTDSVLHGTAADGA